MQGETICFGDGRQALMLWVRIQQETMKGEMITVAMANVVICRLVKIEPNVAVVVLRLVEIVEIEHDVVVVVLRLVEIKHNVSHV